MADRAGVVAGRDGNNATLALRRAELGKPVGRAAQLEGAGLLQGLELEVDARAERGRADQGRAADEGRDPVARLVDRGERELHQPAS